MTLSKILYLLPYALAFVLPATVGIYAWRRRSVVGARPFAFFTLSQASMTLFFLFELLSPSLEAKIFWDDLQFIGTFVAPVSFLAFAVAYAGRTVPKPRLFWSLLWGIVTLSLVLVFTDDLHHLIRPQAWLVPHQPFDELDYPFTSVFWAMFIFAYLLLFASIGILIDELIRPRRVYRAQAATVLIGTAIPIIGAALTMSGLRLTAHRDTTPFTFAISNLIIGWALFRYRLLDLVPIARETVIEQIDDIVIVLDLQERVVDLNRAARAVLLEQRPRLIGSQIGQVFPAWQALNKRAAQDAPVHTELALDVKGNDDKRQFDAWLSTLQKPSDLPAGQLIVLHDITERKAIETALQQASDELEARVQIRTAELENANSQLEAEIAERKQVEQALRESQTTLQLIFDHVVDGISIYEEHTAQNTRTLIDCNAQYARIAGRTREDLLAMGNTLPIQTGLDGEFDRQAFDERLQSGVYHGRFSWLRPDSQENIVEYTAVPLRVQDRLLVIGVDRDVTHEIAAAQEREALIRELEAKNDELERFTYTVSHDLKSPLITIKGFLGFLEQDAASGSGERIKHDVNLIANATDKMQQLLDELLELSRIGRSTNPLQPVLMSDLAREAAKLVAGQITARGIHVDIAPDMPVINGDRPRLLQVFQNLLSNAAKFMGNQREPQIEIDTRNSEGETVYYVRDNGIGIDPQNQTRIFDLFTKLDSSSEGTGIGLAIVKRIIETHDGRIWVESEGPGQGSTFCFTLPGKHTSEPMQTGR